MQHANFFERKGIRIITFFHGQFLVAPELSYVDTFKPRIIKQDVLDIYGSYLDFSKTVFSKPLEREETSDLESTILKFTFGLPYNAQNPKSWT